jgi:tryptophan synthase alpha chain
MNRIEKKFKLLKKSGGKAFIAFITAGYPSLSITKKLVLEFARLEVDIVELGVPFSDPLADGPLIQEASGAALGKKVNLRKILDLVKEIRKDTDIPICLMTYFNPLFCFGEKKFIDQAISAGVDGIIIPDLPPEEGSSFIAAAGKKGLDVICFISPTTSRARIKYISAKARGFIYYVSLTGVTGPRKKLPLGLAVHLKAVKRLTAKPVCVGFGISNSRQIKQLYRYADGVIVGSAIIRKIKENIKSAELVKRVSRFVGSLKKL